MASNQLKPIQLKGPSPTLKHLPELVSLPEGKATKKYKITYGSKGIEILTIYDEDDTKYHFEIG